MPIEVTEDFVQFIQNKGQGFFSCCTIHLQGILTHFNMFHKLPKYIDSTYQFTWYKTPNQEHEDIKSQYFQECSLNNNEIEYKKDVKIVDHEIEDQFCDYRTINFDTIRPFIQAYFTPSLQIQDIIHKMEKKYQIDYQNICAIFFRGNDKEKEIKLPDYELYLQQAKIIHQKNPNIRFLVQSDETEFLQLFAREFPNNHVIFWDEIRHIPRNNATTVDRVYLNLNSIMSKNFLAITWMMSQCNYIVCNTGNCSMWIALFRGHMKRVIQLYYCVSSKSEYQFPNISIDDLL